MLFRSICEFSTKNPQNPKKQKVVEMGPNLAHMTLRGPSQHAPKLRPKYQVLTCLSSLFVSGASRNCCLSLLSYYYSALFPSFPAAAHIYHCHAAPVVLPWRHFDLNMLWKRKTASLCVNCPIGVKLCQCTALTEKQCDLDGLQQVSL